MAAPFYTKFKVLRKKSGGSVVYWLLCLLGIGVIVWIFWSTGQKEKSSAKSSVSNTNAVLSSKTNFPNYIRLVETSSPVALKTNLSILVATNLGTKIAVTNVVLTNTGTLLSNKTEKTGNTNFAARPVQNVFEAQLVLARRGISSGSLDGAIGSQTRSAIRAFQRVEQLPTTGVMDVATKSRLILNSPPYTNYIVASNDLARLRPVNSTWLGKSQQSELSHENILELVSEKSFSHPGFIRRLNPSINWSNVTEGISVQIPNVEKPVARGRVAFIRIQLAEKMLEAFDANTNLVMHFPCSIAARVEKRPAGELHVVVVAPNPDYTFNPEVFPESAEARELNRKLIIPPGPNNPVGVAWIGLDKPGYGIHGTPKPEEVGRTESHGCFRLANWNAELLVNSVSIGTPVFVEP